MAPAWSPDGTEILFEVASENVALLRSISPNGGKVREFSAPFGFCFYAFWSPDSKHIGYIGEVAEKIGVVLVANRDGTDARLVTEGKKADADGSYSVIAGNGAWSPDGARIAYVDIQPPGLAKVWIITDLKSKTESAIADLGYSKDEGGIAPSVCWSPDGQWLLCTMIGKNKSVLWLMSTDGKIKRRLTPENMVCLCPAWTK